MKPETIKTRLATHRRECVNTECLTCAMAAQFVELADTSTEIIANRQAEVRRLRERVAELERELAELKARKGGSE